MNTLSLTVTHEGKKEHFTISNNLYFQVGLDTMCMKHDTDSLRYSISFNITLNESKIMA